MLTGGGNDGIDVAPEIVVPPDESVTLTRGDSVTELKCIANAKPLHELETVWLKVMHQSSVSAEDRETPVKAVLRNANKC